MGVRQAEAVAKRLSMHGIDEIYASTSNRAIQTAKPLSEIIKKSIIELDWCNEGYVWNEFTVINKNGERDWIFSNQESRQMMLNSDVVSLGKKWCESPCFEENIKKGIDRINRETDDFLKGLGYLHNREKNNYSVINKNEKRIALFAHQGFSMSFLSSILDIPYNIFCTHFDISHTGVSVIHFSNNQTEIIPQMLQHSNDSHLYNFSLPTKYNNVIYL